MAMCRLLLSFRLPVSSAAKNIEDVKNSCFSSSTKFRKMLDLHSLLCRQAECSPTDDVLIRQGDLSQAPAANASASVTTRARSWMR